MKGLNFSYTFLTDPEWLIIWSMYFLLLIQVFFFFHIQLLWKVGGWKLVLLLIHPP